MRYKGNLYLEYKGFEIEIPKVILEVNQKGKLYVSFETDYIKLFKEQIKNKELEQWEDTTGKDRNLLEDNSVIFDKLEEDKIEVRNFLIFERYLENELTWEYVNYIKVLHKNGNEYVWEQ